MATHPGVDLLRDGEWQTIQLQADNRSAAKLHFLDFLGTKRVLVKGDGLRHIGNDQMPVMKAIMDCVSGVHVFLLLSAGLLLSSSATCNSSGTKLRQCALL